MSFFEQKIKKPNNKRRIVLCNNLADFFTYLFLTRF